MKFFKRTFGTIDRRYLARSYLISMLYFCIMFPFFLHPDLSPIITIFITLNTLLFPFSKIVWDASKAFVLGETIIVQNALALFVAKYLINAILWSASIFIAPIGIAYLFFKSKQYA